MSNELAPLDEVARFNSLQDFTRPGVVMGADGIVRPYNPPAWLNESAIEPVPPRKSWWRRFRESREVSRCSFCGRPLWKCLNQSALCFGSGQ